MIKYSFLSHYIREVLVWTPCVREFLVCSHYVCEIMRCRSNTAFSLFNYVRRCVKLYVVTIFYIIFLIYVRFLPVQYKNWDSVSVHLLLVRFSICFIRVVNIIMFTFTVFFHCNTNCTNVSSQFPSVHTNIWIMANLSSLNDYWELILNIWLNT